MLSGTFCSNKQVRVPWASISEKPDNFFAPGHLPAGVILRDPSHLRAEEVSLLWDLWIKHQREGSVSLVFTGCEVKDRREKAKKQDTKRKGRYVEVGSSGSDDEEVELALERIGTEECRDEGEESQTGEGQDAVTSPPQIHPASPAAVAVGKLSWLAYLRQLSPDPRFQVMVAFLECLAGFPFI